MCDEYRIQNMPSVFILQDIQQLNIDTLDKEYIDIKHKLESLQLPENKDWEEFRNEYLNEIEQLSARSQYFQAT